MNTKPFRIEYVAAEYYDRGCSELGQDLLRRAGCNATVGGMKTDSTTINVIDSEGVVQSVPKQPEAEHPVSHQMMTEFDKALDAAELDPGCAWDTASLYALDNWPDGRSAVRRL